MYISAEEMGKRFTELVVYIVDDLHFDNWNKCVRDFLEHCTDYANENARNDEDFLDILSELLPYELAEDDYVWDILLGMKTEWDVEQELYQNAVSDGEFSKALKNVYGEEFYNEIRAF